MPDQFIDCGVCRAYISALRSLEFEAKLVAPHGDMSSYYNEICQAVVVAKQAQRNHEMWFHAESPSAT